MADINVQRYEVNVTNNGTTQTITDVGSLSNAFVRITGNSIKGSSGRLDTTGNANPNIIALAVQLTSTDTLTFYKSTSFQVKVMVEVWTYTGDAGGEYEFIVRQRGNIDMKSATTNTSSISGLANRNKAVPIYQGFLTDYASTSEYEMVTLACFINTSSEVGFTRTSQTSTTLLAFYAVVEFTGSAWRVGHAFSNSHDTAGQAGVSVPLNTDSSGVGGSSFDVSDWSTAMIIDGSMGGDTGETGLADCQVVYEPDTTTSVRLKLGDNNARNDSVAYAHVIQCDDLVVSRGFNPSIAEGNGSYGADVTVAGVNPSTPLSELSLEWYTSTTGTGTAWARGCLSAQIRTYNTIQNWIHRSGNNVMAAYGIVDLSGLVPAVASFKPYWAKNSNVLL